MKQVLDGKKAFFFFLDDLFWMIKVIHNSVIQSAWVDVKAGP